MANKEVKSYNELKRQLDLVLTWFESDEIDLEQAISKYKLGIKLAQELEIYLKTAKNKIEKLEQNL